MNRPTRIATAFARSGPPLVLGYGTVGFSIFFCRPVPWRPVVSRGLLACLLACVPACLPACLLACLPACLLACLLEENRREARQAFKEMISKTKPQLLSSFAWPYAVSFLLREGIQSLPIHRSKFLCYFSSTSILFSQHM